MRVAIAFIATVVVAGLPGCAAKGLGCPDAGDECPCSADEDCAAGHTCQSGSCVLVGSDESADTAESTGEEGAVACDGDDDCPDGSTCEDGMCATACDAAGVICGDHSGSSCGTCEGDAECASTGRACVTALATLPGDIVSVRPGPSAVWVVAEDGSNKWGVFGVDPDTGDVEQLVASTQRLYDAIEVNGDVFFGNQPGELRRISADGGSSSLFAMMSGPCVELVVDGNELLCLEEPDGTNGALQRFSLPNNTPEQLWYWGQPGRDLQVVDRTAYFILTDVIRFTDLDGPGGREDLVEVGGPSTFTASSEAVYFTTDMGVGKIGPMGGDVETLAETSYPQPVFTHGDRVYFTDEVGIDPALHSVPTSGVSATLHLESGTAGHLYARDGDTVLMARNNRLSRVQLPALAW